MKTAFWIVTVLLAALFTFSGTMALISSAEYLKELDKMGFPHWFPMIHGPLKIIAAIILLVPRRFYFQTLGLCWFSVYLSFRKCWPIIMQVILFCFKLEP